MGPRLAALLALLARRYGRRAAESLGRAAYAWLSDPANAQARAELLARLDYWAKRGGGSAGRLAGRLGRQVERKRVSVTDWEHDILRLRYQIAEMGPGPDRDAALGVYARQVGAGVHLIPVAGRPERERERVIRVLGAEANMLRTGRFAPEVREPALDAVRAARERCDEAVVGAR